MSIVFFMAFLVFVLVCNSATGSQYNDIFGHLPKTNTQTDTLPQLFTRKSKHRKDDSVGVSDLLHYQGMRLYDAIQV